MVAMLDGANSMTKRAGSKQALRLKMGKENNFRRENGANALR